MRRLVIILSLFALHLSLSATEYRLRFFDDRNGLSHWLTSHVVQDSTGMVWVATWNGLNRFDGTRFVAFKTSPGDNISTPSDKFRHIKLTKDNNLYCLVEDSIFLFNTRACTFDTLSAAQRAEVQERLRANHDPNYRRKDLTFQTGLTRLQNIRYKYVDPAENVWLIDEHGLYIATPVIPHGKRIGKDEVRYIAKRSNGEIWTARRYTNQVTVYDSTLHMIRTEDFGAPVYCIRETEDGHVWLGTKPGALIEIDGKQQHTYPNVRNAYDILPDEQRLWVATYGFGLWVRENSEFEQVPGTEGMYIRRLLKSTDGTLFAATTTGLLELRDGLIALHQRETGNSHSLSSNAVMCLSEHHGKLFIGTEGGGLNSILLSDIQAGKWSFEHLTTKDGLASDIVYEIMPWNDSTLLLQGNNAFSLLHTHTNRIVNFESAFFNYTGNEHLILGEVPPLDLGNARLLVAPHDGLMLLNRSDLQPETKPVRIAISALQRSNGPMEYGVDTVSRIVLSPKERSLGVWFSALDFRNCGAVLYRYRFDKVDAEEVPWSAASSVAEIQLPDLHPGEYILDICSTNAYQQWQNNVRRLVIIVKPTFMESTFGRTIVLVGAFAALLTIIISLLHMRALRKKRKEALEAYLDVQERLSALQNRQDIPQAPLPEVMVAGYLNKNEQFIQTLTAFMEKNMGNMDISVDDLMNAMGMSRSSLTRKMHELFNLSPKDFLQAARIKHACSLLKQTDLSVKEVAYSCGFSNPHYFATSFKASTGLAPSEFREKTSATPNE
ncbi:MAG: helix-turn-helix domain-containing protein [Paludibacteraceae bacterium]|nr:helix-turn-helix domain-containing protein [Paludibacteraceae bacterium]